jgi:D-sedoheptulose 7-phosphate isomerase
MNQDNLFIANIEEHFKIFDKIMHSHNEILLAAQLMVEALKNGKKILICGNGGSAADSQHFAAELIGRFEKERDSIPAIALTTDTSILTALGNDYGYDAIFEKQVKGLGHQGDILIAISTSGSSHNVFKAIGKARSIGLKTIGLLGKNGGTIGKIVDIPVIIPSYITARTQEVHIFVLHYWAAVIERELFP